MNKGKAEAKSKAKTNQTGDLDSFEPYEYQTSQLAAGVNFGCQLVHRLNAKWWQDLFTGLPLERNVGEMLALVHSEISEALEGNRKEAMDTHLPQRKMFEVELADAMIRIMDIAGGLGLDLGGALSEKLEYNFYRQDHQAASRKLKGGKKY